MERIKVVVGIWDWIIFIGGPFLLYILWRLSIRAANNTEWICIDKEGKRCRVDFRGGKMNVKDGWKDEEDE